MTRMKDYTEYIGKSFGSVRLDSVFSKRMGKYCRGYANCTCLACGKQYESRLDHVTSGRSKSCGCLTADILRKAIGVYNYNLDLLLSNTPEMYYVLGIMFSDGNLSTKGTKFKIGLKSEDKYLLGKLGMLLKGGDKLRYNTPQDSYELEGTHPVLYQQFLDHGLTPQKSLTLVIPEHLKDNQHFWRGMIDGDGWVTVSKRDNRFTLGICGTLDICRKFKDYTTNIIGPHKCNEYVRKGRHHNYGQFMISGEKALKMFEHLYQNKGDFYLKRKYEKFTDYKKSL